MTIETVIAWVGDYGYFALFLCLFLGIVGLPINDETLVMLAGFVAATGLLKTLPAFLVTYAGVLSGMNIGFFLGRWFGMRVLDRWTASSPRVRRQVERSRRWLDRRGALVIWLTYFVPGVRHVVPYLIGVGQMSYVRFAGIAFSGGLVWTALFFGVGYGVGENWRQVADALHQYALIAGVGVGLVGLLVWAIRGRRAGNR